MYPLVAWPSGHSCWDEEGSMSPCAGTVGQSSQGRGTCTCSVCVVVVVVRCRGGMIPNCYRDLGWHAAEWRCGCGVRSMPARSHFLYDLVIGCVSIGILPGKCAS